MGAKGGGNLGNVTLGGELAGGGNDELGAMGGGMLGDELVLGGKGELFLGPDDTPTAIGAADELGDKREPSFDSCAGLRGDDFADPAAKGSLNGAGF